MLCEMISKYMDSKGWHYQVLQEGALIKTGFNGKNAQKVDLYIHIEEERNEVHLRSFNYIRVPEDKMNNILRLCSQMNKTYSWVKFYVDEKDMTVTLADDAVVEPSTCGDETFGLMYRMLLICDDAYPEFMRALYL
ncbi:MAG: YbjN domain-containing protein [Lachnospiraceae bacterium]|nr:YbjN domain-containing protein [Lachnospiraceae bacterium]